MSSQPKSADEPRVAAQHLPEGGDGEREAGRLGRRVERRRTVGLGHRPLDQRRGVAARQLVADLDEGDLVARASVGAGR